MGRRILRLVGGLLAMALTVSLVGFVAYALPRIEDLKASVPRLDGSPQETRLDRALNGAIGLAEAQGAAPVSTGVGEGYVVNSPAPEGSGLVAGHWCAETVIDYRIDFTAAELAGRTHSEERTRWAEAFATWSRASNGQYRFRYAGTETFPVRPDAMNEYPIEPASLHDGEIAISYAVGEGQGGQWRDYVHPVLSDALGVGGVGTVEWGETDSRGEIVRGIVVLDALDSANDPHALPTPYVHELGHALGLGHVTDPGQMMFTHAGSNSAIAAGDRRGIQRLASLPCG